MRYALYFAPDPGSPLAARAASWIGRDAATGMPVAQPRLDHLGSDELASLTGPARRYGFHATLKAPFRLAEGTDESDLIAAIEAFATRAAAFDIPSLVVGRLDGFLALVPGGPAPELNAFANSVVAAFEPLRADLSEGEIERRNPGSLTAAELGNLMRWGYPYVFDQFRFHMTLTTRLAEPQLSRVATAAADHFAPALNGPVKVQALSLFVEPGPGAPFVLHSQTQLAAGQHRKSA